MRRVAALPRALSIVAPRLLVLALVVVPGSLGRSHDWSGLAVKGRGSGGSLVAAAPASDDPAVIVRAALSRCGTALSDKQRWLIADVIVNESDRHGYDPLFVQALIEVESTCKPTARSARGAMGLTQVTPATARAVAEDAGLRWRGEHALNEPAFNVRIGLGYLAQLQERFGDLHLAVAAYNLGPAQVARMPRQRARESSYVRRVFARYQRLLSHHSTALL